MLTYLKLSMLGSDLKHWVHFLLAELEELEHLELQDTEGDGEQDAGCVMG